MQNIINKIKEQWSFIISLCFGTVSIFEYQKSGYFAIIAICFGALALFRNKKKTWQVWAGIALGLCGLVVHIIYVYQVKTWTSGILPFRF